MEFIAPIVVGVIASLLAPIALAVTQAKLADSARKYERRCALVDSWRSGLTEVRTKTSKPRVFNSDWYETLRPFLSDELRDQVELGYGPADNVAEFEMGVDMPSPKPQKINLRARRNALSERVDELAKEWKVD